MYIDGIERLKVFTSEIFPRSQREIGEIKDPVRFKIVRYIWLYQAVSGFLEFFNPKNSQDEDLSGQSELLSTYLNYKSYTVAYLEQLYGALFETNFDEFKAKPFLNEFEKLMRLLETGSDSTPSLKEEPRIDVSTLNVKDSGLKEAISNRKRFLEFLYSAKLKYTHSLLTNGFPKSAAVLNVECLKYLIEQKR